MAAQRKDLEYLQRMMLHTNQFSKTYRMEKEHFEYLLSHLTDALRLDELQSMRSTSGNEPIKSMMNHPKKYLLNKDKVPVSSLRAFWPDSLLTPADT
jgi:hypothetical protein